MRIAYDHQIFSWQEYGGISRYFFELATRVCRSGLCEAKVYAPLYINRYLRDAQWPNVIGRYIAPLPKTGRAMQILNAMLVRRLLHRDTPDLVHETYYFEKRLAPARARIVITVHDMIHEKFKQCYPTWDTTSIRKRRAVERADHIICVSENTRRDLVDILGVERSRTSVVHHGCSQLAEAPDAAPPVVGRPYIVYVGLRQCYKNFIALLEAFAISGVLRKEFVLVCFGGGQMNSGEFRQIASLGIPRDAVVSMTGGDRLLANLFRHAAAFVYPSLYEGFGMPPLEAMSCGCPVACSNTSSLPEVCGEAAEYFDPGSPESIRMAIERVVLSSERRAQLIRAGHAQSRRFNWDECAGHTAAVYEALR